MPDPEENEEDLERDAFRRLRVPREQPDRVHVAPVNDAEFGAHRRARDLFIRRNFRPWR